MLNTLLDLERISAHKLDDSKYDELMIGVIIESFDDLWTSSKTNDGYRAAFVRWTYLNVECRNLFQRVGISEHEFNELIMRDDWYEYRRFELMGRLINHLDSGIIITDTLSDKLQAVSNLALLLGGLPTYLDGSEFTNFALFTALRAMNNQVLLNPSIQNYHQFQMFVSKISQSFSEHAVRLTEGRCSPECFVEWADEIGVAVSMLVIHALILILNRHTELKDRVSLDLISSLKFII